jgi:autotransporter-associated beta strand protein
MAVCPPTPPHLRSAARRRRSGARMHFAVAGSMASLALAQTAHATDLATITSRVESQMLSSTASVSTVKGYMSSMQANGSWSDITYTSTAATNWSPGTHLTRMEQMAQDWANPSSSLFHNTTLASDLSLAMSYWISANPQSSNWFDNDISGPQALGEAMVLAQPVFSAAQIASGQSILARAKATIPSFTGQNVVDLSIVGIYSAIVSQSTTDMATAFGSLNGTIFTSNFGTDGIQADDSYHIHGIQLYMGGYGTSYVNDVLNWASIGAGTSYAVTTAQEHLVVNYLLDGTQWFIRGQTLDLTANGRQVTFPTYVGAGDGYVGAIDDALSLGNYRTAELQAFLARQEATNSSGSASSTQNVLSGNKAFFDSDAMVQQRAGWYASVKVTSTRTSQPESGNDQGLENLYLGDGVNEIMVTGNEYLGIQPSWNWRRLPGTTVEQDTRSLKPAADWGAVMGTTTYAGGVSDGNYGAEAFSYNRFDVAAQKSWFFFDKEEVALGAGIHSSNTTYEVDTTINQCLLTSAVSYETTGNATIQTLANGTTITPAGLKWVYQGGVGYFFLTPVSNATIMAVAQTGNWAALNTAASSSNVTQNIFTLYIDHGTAVANGSYSYIAVPGITAAEMDAYQAANPIVVLTNNATVQAVQQTTLNLTQAAFYGASSFTIAGNQTVAASAAATVMLQRQPNVLKMSASSPQALQMALNVTLSNVVLSGSGGTWFDALGSGVATFNLPGGNFAGSTVGSTLSSNGAAMPTVLLVSNDQTSNNTYMVNAAIALPNNTTFQTDSFSTLALGNSVSGNAAVTKTGAGTLILSGTNTFVGDLSGNAGTVRLTSPGASGAGFTNVYPGGTLVFSGASTFTAPLVLAGGIVGSANSPLDIANVSLTAAPNTTSTVMIADPQSPGTGSEVIFTGTLHGTGNINVIAGSNNTNPDGGTGFRVRGTGVSDFSGNLTIGNNVKAEIQTSVTGLFSPIGSGTIFLTAGDHTSVGVLTATLTGGYSEFNLRNNSTSNVTFGNNVTVLGTGLTLLNPLGTAPTGDTVTMGTLRLGNNQTLGVFLNNGNAHPVIFPAVTVTGGNVSFAPKPQGFGSNGTTGSDLWLGNITETSPTTITMTGLRTLVLTGNNIFTGGLNISSGVVQIQNAGALNTATPQAVSFGAIGNGASLDLDGSSVMVGGLSLFAGSAGTITNSSATPSTLTFVNGTSTFGGVIANGPGAVALVVNSGSLTLSSVSSSTANTSVNGGSLFINGTDASPNVILNGGVLGGTGTLLGSVLGGTGTHTISPGNSTANSIGTLTFGALTTDTHTTLVVDLISPVATNDLLRVTGNVTLSGGAVAVNSLAATGLSSLGYYKILSYAGTLTGSVANITLPAVANNMEYTLDTTHDPGFIDLHRGFIGDVDDSGSVDLNDLNIVLNNLGTTTSSWGRGNFDQNATVDLTDLNDVLNELGVSVPIGASVTSVAAPEPASLSVLALSGLLLARRRGSRAESTL